jgi:hypothetical protein
LMSSFTLALGIASKSFALVNLSQPITQIQMIPNFRKIWVPPFF